MQNGRIDSRMSHPQVLEPRPRGLRKCSAVRGAIDHLGAHVAKAVESQKAQTGKARMREHSEDRRQITTEITAILQEVAHRNVCFAVHGRALDVIGERLTR